MSLAKWLASSLELFSSRSSSYKKETKLCIASKKCLVGRQISLKRWSLFRGKEAKLFWVDIFEPHCQMQRKGKKTVSLLILCFGGVFFECSKWALKNTIASDLKTNLHGAHRNLQMESCCVLLNSTNGKHPLEKSTDFITQDSILLQ